MFASDREAHNLGLTRTCEPKGEGKAVAAFNETWGRFSRRKRSEDWIFGSEKS